MPYYENRHEHYDGALVLYQRNLDVAAPGSKHRTRNWYMRITVPGVSGYYDRTTKRTKYEDAYAFAKAEFLRLQQAADMGHSFASYTFEQHWNDWYNRQVRMNAWSEQRKKWHKSYYKRYFSAYFTTQDGKSRPLSQISAQFAAGYWDWRIAYWNTGEGAKLRTYNPKRRGCKTRGTANAKKAPATKTLKMEQSALNQIFYDALERGRMPQVLKMRAPSAGEKPNRRPAFDTSREYPLLVRSLKDYRECEGFWQDAQLHELQKHQRIQLSYLWTVLLFTGMRIGEAREMRWSDVEFDVPVEGTNELIAQIRVSKHTKKGRSRYVQSQPEANDALKAWREISMHTKPSDRVWYGQKVDEEGRPKPPTDPSQSFEAFLRKIDFDGRRDGLLYDTDGDKRTLYSLRHTYATYRIEHANVSMSDLSLNMGCQIKQLEDHYSHVTASNRRAHITRLAKETAPPATASLDDMFIAEATRRYFAGELSEDLWREMAKAKRA